MRRLLSRVLRNLLERLLPTDRQEALGDLEEALASRIALRGRQGSERWYLREATSLLFGVLQSRVRQAMTSRASHPQRHSPPSGVPGLVLGWFQDLRQTTRGLMRDPITTAVITVTLAVAVGATTALFAVADAAFLRPLPYPAADRLVLVYSSSRENPAGTSSLSPLDLRDLEGYGAVIEEIAAWSVGESVHLTDGDEPRRLEAPRASARLFGLLGLKPVVGRFFVPEEEVPGRDDAIVLSHGLWLGTFGGDAAIVGRSVTLDGRRYRVVGVAPAAGPLPREADLWLPLALGPEWYGDERWGWQFLAAVARLRPGIDPATLSPALTDRLAAAAPRRVERGQIRVAHTLTAERVGNNGPAILLLLGAVGLLLVLACANVMNVVLARAERRGREFALRRALGSGAAPLMRLVALENGVLAMIGGLGGLGLALLGTRALAGSVVASLGFADAIGVDHRVALFAVAITALTAVGFGTLPVLRALRADPQQALTESTGRTGSSRASRRVRDGLVVAQVAIASTLLVAVGLAASAFSSLVGREPGFRTDGVLTATIEVPTRTQLELPERAALYRSLMERIRAIPGVDQAGAVAFLPLAGVGWSASFDLIDPDPSVTDPDPGANMRPVAAGYFETLSIPLLEGRTFTDADDSRTEPVAIVDETLARRYWPGRSPVGQRAEIEALSARPATIVGVVGSVPDQSLAEPGSGHIYFPLLQRPERGVTLVVHTEGDAGTVAPFLRAAIHEIDPRIPITEMTTLGARVRRSVAGPETALRLLQAFGAIALLLAAVGIYGVLAYSVAQRTGEIGTRMALGAGPRAVYRSVVGHAMRLWLAGAVLGGIGGLLGARVIHRFVAGVEVAQPLPYALAFLALGGVAWLAALLPALRATSIDPIEALRTG